MWRSMPPAEAFSLQVRKSCQNIAGGASDDEGFVFMARARSPPSLSCRCFAVIRRSARGSGSSGALLDKITYDALGFLLSFWRRVNQQWNREPVEQTVQMHGLESDVRILFRYLRTVQFSDAFQAELLECVVHLPAVGAKLFVCERSCREGGPNARFLLTLGI